MGALARSCACAQRRAALLPGAHASTVRRLCSEKRPPPRAFDAFFPRSKGSAKPSESEAAGARARKSSAEPKEEAKLDTSAASSTTGGGGGGANPSQNQVLMLITGAGSAALLFALSQDSTGGKRTQEISMQHFFTNVLAQGHVQKLVVVNGTQVRVHCSESSGHDSGLDGGMGGGAPVGEGGWSGDAGSSAPAVYYFTIGSVEQFEDKLDAAQVALGVPLRDHVPVQFSSQTSWASELSRFLPTILLIGFFYLLTRGVSAQMGGGSQGMFNVGKSKAVKATKVKTKFKDVAGLGEAKTEIMEFVDIMQNPERYSRLGAKIPKGALLVGPPGCGKTLLARATAGEAKAPFYSISGSDFIEMFVGVGPSRVRDLFAQARANAPCLIFIDEIDAVGRARGKGGFNGGNDERENTLNQLLIEMDGFSASTGVVILAGTNRADVLDPALLRPGRFDRQVVVDKPDIKGRAEIFAVHLAPLSLEGDAEHTAKKLAALTPGFSGAEVANVCNEAALIAARREAAAVTPEHFDAAIDRVIAGLEKKDLVIDPHERRVVAFHEAGHALIGWVTEHADPVMKVSIVPRGKAALGYSQSLPRDVPLHTVDQLADTMCMALGGRAAEEVVFSEVSSGAQNDLERVTNMAYSQVTSFGMSDAVGPLSFGRQGESNTLYKPYSEKTAQLIDSEANDIVSASYERAIALLEQHKTQLHELAEKLLEKEVLNTDDLIDILGERPFKKSVEYDEFINASWEESKTTSAEAAAEVSGATPPLGVATEAA